jgi:hypothetical protein
VILAQEKYTGSIVASLPGENDSGEPDWEARVANPGLGLGEPGQLWLRVFCAKLDYQKDPRLGFVRPVTGVRVYAEERSGHIAEQETLSGHVLCNAKSGGRPGQHLFAVGGGFALSDTSSAAPIESHALLIGGDSEGWVAGADNRGIGETPGTLTVIATCLQLLRQRGLTPLDSLRIRVVSETYELLPGPDAVEHSVTCLESAGETSWAISGGFDVGFTENAPLPHVYESAPSEDGKSWLVGAINPPLAPEAEWGVYAVCLVEVH